MYPEPTALPVRAEHDESLDNGPSAFDSETDDQALLESVVTFYRERLKEHAPALAYLQDRGLTDPELLEAFELGYADRALGRALPKTQLKAGKQVRQQLQRLGVYRPTGHGHFNGCVVVPMRISGGEVAQLYGRKIARHPNDRKALHVTMAAESFPLGDLRGVLNAGSLQATDEVILTDSVMNALTFWSAGLRNVTAALPTDGFTEEHLSFLKASSIERILLAYRNTDTGNRVAEDVAARLVAAGHEVFRILFPPGLDANDYAVREGPDRLVTFVRQADRRCNGTSVAVEVPKEPATPDLSTSPFRPPEPPIDAEVTDTDVIMTFGDRRYRVRGLDKNHSLDRMKINLLVSRDDLIHADTLDLYAARTRNSFIKQASGEIYIEEETIKRDLGTVLLKLEELQEKQIQDRLRVTEEKPVTLTDAERKEALELLNDPRLLDRILTDYDRCGIVGEETNKLVSYLACVSRRLPEPLAVMIQSGSGTGKTSLMDATLAFMPPEDQIQYSAMTGQALYYMGSRSMKHKILAVAEEEGVAQAAYALKLLQSDGRLRIASAEKDGDTGRQKTQDYEVEGPVMMFLTTTAQTPDPELQNRCLTLRVNEQPEQTDAIHARQRAAYTLAGRRALDERKAIQSRHQNAQRLLEARSVIIPWADALTFRRDQPSMRRDHAKYLSLIASITLLHQHQRPMHADANGSPHIEATLDDIEQANRLASEVLGRSLDALMPQTRQLLVLLDDYVKQRCLTQDKPRRELRFKQREIREAFGWSDFAIRKHLARLVDLEYVLVYRTRRGNEREYELLYQGEGRDGEPFLLGLIDVSELRKVKYDGSTSEKMKYDERTERLTKRNEPHPSPIRAPIEPHPSTSKIDVTAFDHRQIRQDAVNPPKNDTQAPQKKCAS